MLQTRDLACYLLVTLRVAREASKMALLIVATELMDHAADVVRAHSSSVVGFLREFRSSCLDALRLLAQWRKALLDWDEAPADAPLRRQEAPDSEAFLAMFEERLSAALDAFQSLLDRGNTGIRHPSADA